MLAGWPLPLVPIQLLVLNLITDGAPALALGVEKGDPDIMDQPPRPVNEPIINRDMVIGIAVQTVAISLAVLAAFQIGMAAGRGSRPDDGLCHAVHLRAAAGLHLPLGALLAVGHRRLYQQVDAVGGADLAGHPAGHHLRALPAADLWHHLPDRAAIGWSCCP